MREETEIRLIAFDLDGTLLTSDKEIAPSERRALFRAAEAGIELVPATGRFLDAMPDGVRNLPFLHYAITINGAQVVDMRKGAAIARAEIPLPRALEIMRFLDTLPVLYDVVMDNWGHMAKEHYARIGEVAVDEHQLKMLRDLRKPVDDLKALVEARGGSVQKIQPFTRDSALRAELLESLPTRFPGAAVSSSYPNNIEINDERANKGEALKTLADCLNIGLSQTLAFGDGLNDLSMLRTAGIGVAMGNACAEIRDAAAFVTLSCDEGGVAAGIEKFCFAGIREKQGEGLPLPLSFKTLP
ncbi:MAG: HAD family phosphatase [Synergistaceae bacterium]|nr:HAD family phosphatase [Synergistaceae bacterium]